MVTEMRSSSITSFTNYSNNSPPSNDHVDKGVKGGKKFNLTLCIDRPAADFENRETSKKGNGFLRKNEQLRKEKGFSSGIVVVGYAPGAKEKQIFRLAEEAIFHSKNKQWSSRLRCCIGVKLLERGTYQIDGMDREQMVILNILLSIRSSSKKIPFSTSSLVVQYLGYEGEARPIAIFKPRDEVRGARNSFEDACRSTDGILPKNEVPNEVIIAGLRRSPYLPIAMDVRLASDKFSIRGINQKQVVLKEGVLQEFVSADPLSSIQQKDGTIPELTSEELQRVAITDLAFCNTDRNLGNMMYSPKKGIVQIDHALVLPSRFASACEFAWTSWGIAKLPFTKDSLYEIEKMVFAKDRKKILAAYPSYPPGSLEVMEICYHLLRKGAKAGLTPFQISLFYQAFGSEFEGSMLTRMYNECKDKKRQWQRVAAMKKQLNNAIKKVKAKGSNLDCVQALEELLR
jgi:hypothetical protein